MASKLFEVLIEPAGFFQPEAYLSTYCGLVSTYGLNQIIGMLSRRQKIEFEKHEFKTNYTPVLGRNFIKVGKFKVVYRYVGIKQRITEVKSRIYNNFFREDEK